MKQWITLLLFLVVSSCGNNQETSTVTEVEYWSFFAGGDGGYMDDLVNQFNEAHDNIKINMTFIDWGTYYTKLSTAQLSGDLPDIATAHSHMLPTVLDEGTFYTIEELNPDFSWDQFAKNVADVALVDGQYIAVPMDTHGVVMFYNPDYVNGTSLVDVEGNWTAQTIDQLLIGLEEIKTKYPDIIPFSFNNPDTFTQWLWYSLYVQAGGQKFIDNEGFLEVDIEPATKALNTLKNMLDKGFNKVGYTGAADLTQEGKTAITMEGSWTSGGIRARQPNIKAIPMPPFLGKSAAWANNHVLIFPKNDDIPTAKAQSALLFAQFLLDNGAYWALAGHIPTKVEVQNSEEYTKNPNSVFKGLVAMAQPWPQSKYILLSIDGTLQNYIQEYLEGRITDPKEVFTRINAEIKNKK